MQTIESITSPVVHTRILLQYFINPLKRSCVRWLHFEAFSAIQVWPTFLVSDIRALWRSALTTRVPEIRNVCQTWITKCNHLTSLPFKGLKVMTKFISSPLCRPYQRAFRRLPYCVRCRVRITVKVQKKRNDYCCLLSYHIPVNVVVSFIKYKQRKLVFC